MKKVIAAELLSVLVLAGLLWLFLSKPALRDVPLSEIEEEFLLREDSSDMEKYGAMRLRRNFSLDETDFSEVIYYAQSDTMSVNVFLIIKLADASQEEAVKTAFETYLGQQIQNFEGYGEHQTELLKSAEIYESESYMGLFISDAPKEWMSLLSSGAEGKK